MGGEDKCAERVVGVGGSRGEGRERELGMEKRGVGGGGPGEEEGGREGKGGVGIEWEPNIMDEAMKWLSRYGD